MQPLEVLMNPRYHQKVGHHRPLLSLYQGEKIFSHQMVREERGRKENKSDSEWDVFCSLHRCRRLSPVISQVPSPSFSLCLVFFSLQVLLRIWSRRKDIFARGGGWKLAPECAKTRRENIGSLSFQSCIRVHVDHITRNVSISIFSRNKILLFSVSFSTHSNKRLDRTREIAMARNIARR